MAGLAEAEKVVLTHVAALRRKYGPAGVTLIRSALRTLVSRDLQRGITTVVLDVSRRAALRPLGMAPVADLADHQAFRAVVDAVADLAEPAYLLLLGGPDVVPQVPLPNPMPAPDPDPDVPSDLPYAVPRSSSDPAALVGPTRVVGRLPDLPGAGGIEAARAYAAVIRAAARWTTAPLNAYAAPLALSTARWQVCTAATLAALASGAALQLAPPRTPPWTVAELAPPLHLVNLHGATLDPRWVGDPGFAATLGSGDLAGLRNHRGLVLAECCFAAEVWEPALAGGAVPLPAAYLAAGAYGLIGPTCISYGARTTPDAADVLVRMVGEEVLRGASLGRALLSARQRYVAAQPVMTPVDLKTLAQFDLLGDPSVQPVEAPVAETRSVRRSQLVVSGGRLGRTAPIAVVVGGPQQGATRTYEVRRGAPIQIAVTVRRRRDRYRVREERMDVSGALVGTRELESR